MLNEELELFEHDTFEWLHEEDDDETPDVDGDDVNNDKEDSKDGEDDGEDSEPDKDSDSSDDESDTDGSSSDDVGSDTDGSSSDDSPMETPTDGESDTQVDKEIDPEEYKKILSVYELFRELYSGFIVMKGLLKRISNNVSLPHNNRKLIQIAANRVEEDIKGIDDFISNKDDFVVKSYKEILAIYNIYRSDLTNIDKNLGLFIRSTKNARIKK